MLRVNAINRQGLLKCLTFNPKSLVFKTVSVPCHRSELLHAPDDLIDVEDVGLLNFLGDVLGRLVPGDEGEGVGGGAWAFVIQDDPLARFFYETEYLSHLSQLSHLQKYCGSQRFYVTSKSLNRHLKVGYERILSPSKRSFSHLAYHFSIKMSDIKKKVCIFATEQIDKVLCRTVN